MNKILYKSIPADKKPNSFKFQLGKWHKIKGELVMCQRGFHASKNIIDDKQCWEGMKILKWKKWTKKDSVSLAIYATELVLPNFEKEYPHDKRDKPQSAGII